MDVQALYIYLKRAIDDGKTVTLIKRTIGIYATGYDLNIIIKFDDETIANNVYKWKEWNIYQIADRFDKLKKAIYKTLYKQALKLLSEKLGFKSIDELERKVELFHDSYDNPVAMLEDWKMYKAEFCKYDLQFFVGEDIETYIFHKPEIKEVKDC